MINSDGHIPQPIFPIMVALFYKQGVIAILFLSLIIKDGAPYILAPAWLPFRRHIQHNDGIASCGTPHVATVVLLLRLTPMDIAEAKDSTTLWNFDAFSRTLHDRASQIEGNNLYNLFIVERYLPSDEFVEATNALTVVQKSHIGELSIGNRRVELEQIMNGVILSLPDEVQIKARNFMELLNFLVCLHSTLREPPYY